MWIWAIGSVLTVITRITAGGRMVKMNKVILFLRALWTELSPVVELSIYLGIAYVMQRIFNLTSLQAIVLVYSYFIMCLMRVYIEKNR